MSYLEVPSQRPATTVIDSALPNGTIQPGNVIIKMNDSSSLKSKKQADNGRQKQEELKKKHPPETPIAFWMRRIFVGKDEYEEEQEKRNHKRLNWTKREIRRHVAEFIGAFFIVFFIAGIQVNQDFYGASNSGVANIDKGLVAGFTLAGLIYCFGNVSGAHFNPCVTLGFFLRGAFNLLRTITYIIAQIAGAISGAAVLYGLFGNVDGLGTTTPGDGLEAKNAFGVEILITFILITVILTTAENAQILGATSGLAVGATFGALELFAWNFSGASANPWRTIGPTIISGVGWSTYWVYIVGPLVGTILAVLVQRLMVTGIKRTDTEEAGEGAGKNGEQGDDD